MWKAGVCHVLVTLRAIGSWKCTNQALALWTFPLWPHPRRKFYNTMEKRQTRIGCKITVGGHKGSLTPCRLAEGGPV